MINIYTGYSWNTRMISNTIEIRLRRSGEEVICEVNFKGMIQVS